MAWMICVKFLWTKINTQQQKFLNRMKYFLSFKGGQFQSFFHIWSKCYKRLKRFRVILLLKNMRQIHRSYGFIWKNCLPGLHFLLIWLKLKQSSIFQAGRNCKPLSKTNVKAQKQTLGTKKCWNIPPVCRSIFAH